MGWNPVKSIKKLVKSPVKWGENLISETVINPTAEIGTWVGIDRQYTKNLLTEIGKASTPRGTMDVLSSIRSLGKPPSMPSATTQEDLSYLSTLARDAARRRRGLAGRALLRTSFSTAQLGGEPTPLGG